MRVEPEKRDDIADHLGEDETVAPRHDRYRACAETGEFVEPARIRHHVDRLELDPTDREVFLDPEAARSVRLPEHLDRLVHPLSSRHLSTDPRARFRALQLGARRAYSPAEFQLERRKR